LPIWNANTCNFIATRSSGNWRYHLPCSVEKWCGRIRLWFMPSNMVVRSSLTKRIKRHQTFVAVLRSLVQDGSDVVQRTILVSFEGKQCLLLII
jgi:hypothetical protein